MSILTSNFLLSVVLLAAAGCFAGVLSGLFGIGGGAVLVPILVATFTLQNLLPEHIVHMAVGTSLAIIIPTAIRSYRSHRKHGAGNVDLLNGSNNLDNTNPLFVNVTDDTFDATFDYNLQPGSDAIDAGALGVDIGLYDNAGFNFNNFGFTPGVPTVIITAITDQIAPGDNVEVTIQSSSN